MIRDFEIPMQSDILIGFCSSSASESSLLSHTIKFFNWSAFEELIDTS